MKSRIQNITPIYTKFENILPYELSHNNIAEELERARYEINSIINDDLRNTKNLAISQNKAIAFNEFLKPPAKRISFCLIRFKF
jgi:hypothetical protein